MNSEKKKRSSLRPVAAMEDNTEDRTRLKRRISFSGKKAVRMFSSEECWDNSVEVSDHSADGGRNSITITTKTIESNHIIDTAVPATSRQQQQQTENRHALLQLPIPPPPVANKENIYCDSSSNRLPIGSSLASQTGALNVSALSTTMDFINKTQRLSIDYKLEQSVEFSLLGHEHQNRISMQKDDLSFPLEDIELDRLRRTEQKQKAAKRQPVQKLNEPLREISLTSVGAIEKITDSTRRLPECNEKSMFCEDSQVKNADTNDPITIFMDETIVADSDQSKGEILNYGTNHHPVGKEVDSSTEFETEFRGFLQTTISSPPSSTSAMVMSMEVDSPNYTSAERKEERKTIYFNNKGNDQLEESRSHSVSAALIDMPIEQKNVEVDSSVEFENDFRGFLKATISTSQNNEAEMDVTMEIAPPYTAIKGKRREQRKTIIFNDVGDNQLDESVSAKVNKPIKQRKTILFKDDHENCNQMDLTNISKSKNSTTIPAPKGNPAEVEQLATTAVLESGARNQNAPKVLVVRKICAPQLLKTNGVDNLEKQRFQRYQKKQQEELKNELTVKSSPPAANKTNVSLSCSSNDCFFSPTMSSPILPPEYLPSVGNKKLNLRQLNHDIEHGKINIFPDTPKTPLTKCRAFAVFSATKTDEKSKRQNNVLPNLTEVEIQTSSVNSTLNLNKPEMRKTYFDFDDDMLLDNTSFYTKAKLGDETASRNSSKSSSSQKRETIHFNSEIEQHELIKQFQDNNTLLEPAIFANESATLGLNSMDDSVQRDVCNKIEIVQKNIDVISVPRKTLYFSDNIELEADKNSSIKPKHNINKQSVYFNDEIEKNLGNDNQSVFDPSTTVHFIEDIEVEDHNVSKLTLEKSNRNIINTIQSEHFEVVSDKMALSTPSNEIRKNSFSNKRETFHISDDIELEPNLKEKTVFVPKPRQTLNFSEDIELEEPTVQVKTMQDLKAYEAVKSRQTLYCTENIELEVESISPSLSLENSKQRLFQLQKKNCENNMDCSYLTNEPKQNMFSKSRETLHFSDDIELEQGTNTKKELLSKPRQTRNCFEDIELEKANKTFKSRQTLHFSDDIDLDVEDNVLPQLHLDKCKEMLPNSTQSQQQKVNVNDISDISSSSFEIKQNIAKKRETFYFSDAVEIELNSNQRIVTQTRKSSNCLNDTELEMTKSEHQHKISKPRQTLHFTKDMELEADTPLPNLENSKQIATNSRRTQLQKTSVENDMDCSLFPNKPKQTCNRKRETLHFSDDIELEPNTNSKIKIICKPTFSNSRQTIHLNNDISIDSEPRIDQLKMPFKSPNKLHNRLHNLFEGTPHRSLIEFESFERKTKDESLEWKPKGAIPKRMSLIRCQNTYDQSDSSINVSGLKELGNDSYVQNSNANARTLIEKFSTANNKRLTANLTPNLPQPKKRQTVIFTDCDLETSTLQPQRDRRQAELTVDNKKHQPKCIFPVNIDETCRSNSSRVATTATNSVFMELSDDECEIVCPEIRKTLTEASPKCVTHLNVNSSIASHIPVLISSARKSNSILARLQSPIKLDDDDDKKSQLNYSLDTIENPRKAKVSTRQCKSRSLLKFPENEFACEGDEENPITISDVSTHYLALRNSAGNHFLPEIKPFADLTLCNTSNLNFTRESRSGKADTKQHKALVGENSILDLSGLDEIDKTRLSLVETLLGSDSEHDEDVDEEEHPLQKIAIDITTDSFVLPALPSIDIGWERLKRLRQRPTIADVQNYYQNLELSSKTPPVEDWFTPDGKFNSKLCVVNDDSEEEEIEEKKEDEVDIFIANYYKELERDKLEVVKQFNREQATNLPRELYEVRLARLVSEFLPLWRLNYEMLNILEFTHTNLRNLCVKVIFEDKVGLGLDYEIKNVVLHRSRLPEKNWKPFDFMLYFQIKVELCFDLRSWCSGNNETDVLQLIQKIDQVFVENVTRGRQLWRVIRGHEAALIRKSNRTFVRKTVQRIKEPENEYARVEKIEFEIEVMNFKKICFNDIVMPRLHLFCEDIQYLPIGLEFLKIFLKDPCSYLKK